MNRIKLFSIVALMFVAVNLSAALGEMDPQGIYRAAQNNDVKRLKQVFDNNKNPKLLKVEGFALVVLANDKNNKEVVEYLASIGVDTKKAIKFRETVMENYKTRKLDRIRFS